MEVSSNKYKLFQHAQPLARTLAFVYAAFLSIFAADAFSKQYSLFENIISLFMHLLPSGTVLGILFVSWKRPLAGVIGFLLLAILYLIWAWKRFPFSVYLIIDVPPVIMSILLFIVWRKSKTA